MAQRCCANTHKIYQTVSTCRTSNCIRFQAACSIVTSKQEQTKEHNCQIWDCRRYIQCCQEQVCWFQQLQAQGGRTQEGGGALPPPTGPQLLLLPAQCVYTAAAFGWRSACQPTLSNVMTQVRLEYCQKSMQHDTYLRRM